MVKVNDIVRFLNDVGGGRVVRVQGNMVYVEDEDGFERPALTREVVVVDEAKSTPKAYEKPITVSRIVEPDKPAPRAVPQPAAPSEPIVETAEGNTINMVLAFQAHQLKHLNTTTFDAVLVNDSNYFVYVNYLSRTDDESDWTLRYSGTIEPNFQVVLEEFGYDNLNELEHIAVQYVAFKQGKKFRLKNPALVEHHVDTTKFYKLHSFQQNEYFDEPVIAFTIVRNDAPGRAMSIDAGALERAMKQKHHASSEPERHVSKPAANKAEPIVTDLHISALLDNTNGMSNSEMLNYQLDKFRQVMREHLNHPGTKLVFIHGKGEGVLRRALLEELRRKFPRCEAQDASFREYGFGATQVTIHK